MSFVSVFYLLFLAFCTGVYYRLRPSHRPAFLLCVSYLFYVTWQPAFLLVLIIVTAKAYFAAKAIERAGQNKKAILTISVFLLLLPLVFFKYFNFLSENVSYLFGGAFGVELQTISQPYLIPIGISFFTFQAISYVADVYRGYLKPETSPIKFAAYLAFFPTLLAGPIERAKSMLSQLGQPVVFEYANIRAGLQLILWGVFKKVVIADRMMAFIKSVYGAPQDQPGLFIYFAMIFSMLQVFCDFSAYSDIAVGSARIFGIQLSKNFDDRVYASPSREIFWQGWHRSLTSWLRDYVFFPLSRGAKSRVRMCTNLMIVYLLVGVWHGATWGFVTWGALNGAWLVFENATKQWRRSFFTRLGINVNGGLYYFAGWLVAFHVAAVISIMFRSASPAAAINFVQNIVNSNTGLLESGKLRTCFMIGLFLFLMDMVNRRIPKGQNFDAFLSVQTRWVRWVFYVVLAELILRYSFIFDQTNFRYFSF